MTHVKEIAVTSSSTLLLLSTLDTVIFGGQIFVVQQYLAIRGFIFMVAACTAGKGRQGSFIRGKNIRGPVLNHENHKYFAPQKSPTIRYMPDMLLLGKMLIFSWLELTTSKAIDSPTVTGYYDKVMTTL